MPNLKRQALEEYDTEYLDSHDEISELFEETPAILQFKGSDLRPDVVAPSEPIIGDWYFEEDNDPDRDHDHWDLT